MCVNECVFENIRNSFFLFLLFTIFFFSSSCGVWLPGCALTLIFCVSALAATHKREHLHTYILYSSAHVFYTTRRQGEKAQAACCLCIHTQNRATHVFHLTERSALVRLTCAHFCVGEWQRNEIPKRSCV